jgi:hypothetical protein
MESMNVSVDLCIIPIGVGVTLRRNSAGDPDSPERHSGGQVSQELPVEQFQLRNSAVARSNVKVLVFPPSNRRGNE